MFPQQTESLRLFFTINNQQTRPRMFISSPFLLVDQPHLENLLHSGLTQGCLLAVPFGTKLRPLLDHKLLHIFSHYNTHRLTSTLYISVFQPFTFISRLIYTFLYQNKFTSNKIFTVPYIIMSVYSFVYFYLEKASFRLNQFSI